MSESKDQQLKTQSLKVGDDKNFNEQIYVQLSKNQMKEFKLLKYDSILISGKKGKRTIAYTLPNEQEDNIIKMKKSIRQQLGVEIGDFVKVHNLNYVKHLTKIKVLPFKDQVKNIHNNLIQDYLIPYFNEAQRVVKKGDVFSCKRKGLIEIEFKIVETEPFEFGIVDIKTKLSDRGEPIVRQGIIYDYGYEDVGGCRNQINQISQMIGLHLNSSQQLKKFNLQEEKGFLIYGPKGCGKNLIIQAVAVGIGLFLIQINGEELIHKDDLQASQDLEFALLKAQQNKPSIIYLENLDQMISNRNLSNQSIKRKPVYFNLIQSLDEISRQKQIFFVGETNNPDKIDSELRKPGRFDQIIEIKVPTYEERLDILKIHTQNMKLDQEVDLEEIAKLTSNFVGSNLVELCNLSGHYCINNMIQQINIDAEEFEVPDKILQQKTITQSNFLQAFQQIFTFDLITNDQKLLNINWNEIQGIQEVKSKLEEYIVFPILHFQKYQSYGILSPKGVLLYGPKDCGKKFLVKALINQYKINFINLNLKEAMVNQGYLQNIFKRAKYQKPCLILIDELDQVFYENNNSLMKSEIVQQTIQHQLIKEIDNSDLDMIFIGITDKPEILNSACLQRFNQGIYISEPNEQLRLTVFKTQLENINISQDVDLNFLANLTQGCSCLDIKQICQNTIKAALKETQLPNRSYSVDIQFYQLSQVNPISELNRKHFEVALSVAKRSVLNIDLQKFEKMNQLLVQKSKINVTIKWPEFDSEDKLTQQNNLIDDGNFNG